MTDFSMVDLANDLLRDMHIRPAEPQPMEIWSDVRWACGLHGIRFTGDTYIGGGAGAQAVIESPHDGRRYRVLLVPEETEVVLQEAGQ